jgi:hypothetical protein
MSVIVIIGKMMVLALLTKPQTPTSAFHVSNTTHLARHLRQDAKCLRVLPQQLVEDI